MIRVNLLPVREARLQASIRRQGIILACAAGLGLLVCVGLHLGINSKIASQAQILTAKNNELKKLEATQTEVRRFEKERAEIESKLAVIREIEKARTGPVRVLDEVATRIPKRAWLTTLSAKEGALQFEGRSLDAEIVADFLISLEASPMMSQFELQETQLKEFDGLKLNTFKFRGTYPHPKPPAASKKKASGKKKRGRKKRK